jgi:kynurenine 3-monooxygenase
MVYRGPKRCRNRRHRGSRRPSIVELACGLEGYTTFSPCIHKVNSVTIVSNCGDRKMRRDVIRTNVQTQFSCQMQRNMRYFCVAGLLGAALHAYWVAAFIPVAELLNHRQFDLASSSAASNETPSNRLQNLRVAIVGGGPSGLLVAHRLLQEGACVNLYERRPRPGNLTLESRAYALGVGIRGRTAIQSVDLALWKVVQKRGFASDRFILHIGPLSFRLRDECNSKANSKVNHGAVVEPSLLLYQSDLCGALTDELEKRWSGSGMLFMCFGCEVLALDLRMKALITNTNGRRWEPFDLVVGCDGVNSIVRQQIAADWPDFKTTQDLLPGVFKVVQLPSVPPALDPTAVQLLSPKSGSVTAFVEPTANGRCCVLLAGSNITDILFSSDNQTVLAEELAERFPLLVGPDLESAAYQLHLQGEVAQASVVTCNTYHYGNIAVLSGDAAHATGGVSGQGVNSALQDAATLANCLATEYDPDRKDDSLHSALLSYSQLAVPEGKALYDLSFGPKPSSLWRKFIFSTKSALDIIFKGRWGIGALPLQTILTTSLSSFADIRVDRGMFYSVSFPNQSEWNQSLAELDSRAKEFVTQRCREM